jgi:hypothetical protein
MDLHQGCVVFLQGKEPSFIVLMKMQEILAKGLWRLSPVPDIAVQLLADHGQPVKRDAIKWMMKNAEEQAFTTQRHFPFPQKIMRVIQDRLCCRRMEALLSSRLLVHHPAKVEQKGNRWSQGSGRSSADIKNILFTDRAGHAESFPLHPGFTPFHS